jgi:hypothetical protein
VDITANVTPESSHKFKKLGGAVVSDDARYHTIRAKLALEKLESLAKRHDVRFIAPAAQAMNNSASRTDDRQTEFYPAGLLLD